MSFDYDATGVKDEGYELLPEGWFPFEIIEAEEGISKKGHQQVMVQALCLDPRYREKVLRHWVTFLPNTQKGAGMAIHFLKCIGQPHEDKIVVEPQAWTRARFMGKVTVEEYQGKRNNKFGAISPWRDQPSSPGTEPPPEPLVATVTDDDIPF